MIEASGVRSIYQQAELSRCCPFASLIPSAIVSAASATATAGSPARHGRAAPATAQSAHRKPRPGDQDLRIAHGCRDFAHDRGATIARPPMHPRAITRRRGPQPAPSSAVQSDIDRPDTRTVRGATPRDPRRSTIRHTSAGTSVSRRPASVDPGCTPHGPPAMSTGAPLVD